MEQARTAHPEAAMTDTRTDATRESMHEATQQIINLVPAEQRTEAIKKLVRLLVDTEYFGWDRGYDAGFSNGRTDR